LERPTTINESYSIFNSSQAIPITVSYPVNCLVTEQPQITRECGFNTAIPQPSYNNLTNQCENVTREASYIITHNATNGIVSVAVMLTLGSVSLSLRTLPQKYQITFLKINSHNVTSYLRSGNPGYIVGKPVIAGRSVTSETGSQIIEINPDPLSWLTVIALSAPLGDCLEVKSRRSVLFGEDLRTGCVMRVTYDNITQSCSFLQSLAITRLRGSDLPTHVAVFGNPDPANSADWVPLLKDPQPAMEVVNPGSGVCPAVPVNVHLEVLYALTGDFTNPQSKIVGARFSYVTQNIQFICHMPFCQSQFSEKTQLVEFSSSVAFVDVSSRPEQLLKPPFRVSTELPADFFYPFFSGGRSVVCLTLTWVVVIVGISVVLQSCC
jgi:tectonic-1/3